jgi:hypothetical protein
VWIATGDDGDGRHQFIEFMCLRSEFIDCSRDERFRLLRKEADGNGYLRVDHGDESEWILLDGRKVAFNSSLPLEILLIEVTLLNDVVKSEDFAQQLVIL